jgi:hypothetical protein
VPRCVPSVRPADERDAEVGEPPDAAVGYAHYLVPSAAAQQACRERGARPGGTGDGDRPWPLGRRQIAPASELDQREVYRSLNVALAPLVVLAHVDERDGVLAQAVGERLQASRIAKILPLGEPSNLIAFSSGLLRPD